MLAYDGFRLIKIVSGVVSGLVVDKSIIEYTPEVKYRIDKTSLIDPTIRVRREPYNEDTIECEPILTASELTALLYFIDGADSLYIEFNVDDVVKQFQVTVEKLPQTSDDSRFHNHQNKITLKALYTSPSHVDFDNTFGWGNNWGGSWGF